MFIESWWRGRRFGEEGGGGGEVGFVGLVDYLFESGRYEGVVW